MRKPSEILARARNGSARTRPPAAPSGPQVRSEPAARQGPGPFAVVAAAAGAGVLLAKLIDWRSHAHPRR